MKDLADNLASYGRYGDTMLMHVQPREVAGLQALAEANGTSLTVNPHTGLPEAFSLGDAFTSLLPTLVGAALAPATGGASLGLTGMMATAAPIVGGALTGAAIASAKDQDPLMGALTGGFGGYGGGSLGTSLANMGAGQTAASTQAANIGNALNVAPDAAANIAKFGPMTADQADTLANVAQFGAMSTPAAPAVPQGIQNMATGAQNLMGMGDMSMGQAYDAFKAAGGSGAQLAMPLGMAGLSGLEPSDLYPSNKLGSDEDKYDPYATLNLGGNTGLKLYAGGGSITTGGLRDLYGTSDNALAPMYTSDAVSRDGFGVGRLDALAERQEPGYAEGGLAAMASKKGGYLDGAGDGMSDSIPASIEGRQPARLADGEFVVPADVVSHIGNGSSKAGAKRLYAMMDKVRTARTGTKKQGKQINPNKYLPA